MMNKMNNCYTVTFFSVVLFFSSPSTEAAKITLRGTDLAGTLRPGARVTILRAVNAENTAIRSNALINPTRTAGEPARADGEIDIVINDATVRAITVRVAANRALSATLQNILVIDQTITAALPDAKAPCCRCRRCRKLCSSAALNGASSTLDRTKPSAGDTIVVVSVTAPLQLPSKTLATVSQNTMLKVLGTQGDWIWANVNLSGKESSGWILRKHVRVVPLPLQPGDKVAVASRTANLQVGAKILTVVRQNQVFEVSRAHEDWVWTTVRSNEKQISGWIQAKYLRRLPNSSDLANK